MDQTQILSVKLDDGITSAASSAAESLDKLGTASDGTLAALRRYNEEARQFGIQGAKNLATAALIEGSALAMGTAYLAAKGAMAEYNAASFNVEQSYSDLTSKTMSLRQATNDGTVSLSDFGTILRNFGLTSAAGAFDWLNRWSGGMDEAKSKTASLSQQLSTTREDFELLGDQIAKSALAASLSGPVTKNDATAAANVFVAAPNFNTAAMSLTDYIRSANDLATAMGTTVPEAAKKLVAAVNDSSAAAKQAQSQGIVGFNSTLVAQIALLQASGDRTAALSLYMDTLGKSIDEAAQPITPFAEAMRKFYALFEGRDQSGIFDGFFKKIQDALQSIATFTVNQLTTIVGAFLHAKDAVSIFVFGGTGGAPTPSSATAPIVPTYNTNISAETRAMIDNSDDALAKAIGPSLDAAIQQAVKKFASQIIPVESSDRQIDARTGATLTSDQGAQGIMQLMPAVSSAYHVDPTIKQQNINGGLQLLYDLYKRYDGDLVKVAIAYNWNPASADAFFMGNATIPSETVKFVQKTTGLTQAQFQDRFKDQLAGTAYAGQNTTDALALANSGGGLTSRQRANLAQQQLLNTALDTARNDLSVAVNSGDEDAFSNAINRIATLDAAIAKAKGEAITLISETAKSAQAAAQAADLSGKQGLDKAIATIKAKYDAAAASSGQPFDQTSFDSEVASKQIELANEAAQKQTALQKAYTDATTAIETQNARQKDLIDSYGVSTQAVAFATNAVKAQTDADKAYTADDPARLQAIKDRTAALNQETLSKNDNAAAQDVHAFEASNELIQTQISLLGASTEAQNSEIAALTERHKWGLTANDDLSEWQEKAVAAAKANADLKTTLDQQKSSLADLSSIFTKSFDSIGNAISTAFVTGKGAAVDFGDVVKAVVTQIIKDLLQLAVINPIINELFNTNKTTLGSALTARGVVSGSSGGGGGGLGSLFSTGSSLASGASTVSGAFGGPTTSSLLSQAGNYLGLTGPGGLASQTLWTTGAGGIPVEGAYSAGQVAASGSTMTVGGLASATGSVLGGAGAGFAAGSYLGELVQSSLNKTGPAPTIGAGVGALGGAIAGQILIPIPVIGALIGGVLGGALGGAGGGLIGPHPASSYSSTGLSTPDGQLAIGKTVSQIYDPSADVAALTTEVNTLNAVLASSGVKIFQQIGQTQIGQNTPGSGYKDPTKFASLDESIAAGNYKFASGTDANFNDKVNQQSFAGVQSVIDWITKYNAAQQASAQYIANTDTVITGLNKTNGSLNDTITAITASFQEALDSGNAIIATGDLSAAQVDQVTAAEDKLSVARDKSIKTASDVAASQEAANQASYESRYLSAQASVSGNIYDGFIQKLYTFDQGSQPQIDAYKKSLVAVYGDSVTSTEGYAADIALVEKTLGEERLAIVTEYNQQVAAALANIVASEASFTARTSNAKQILAGQSQSPIYQEQNALATFDAGTQPQRDAFSKQLTDLYGTSFTATKDYAAHMLTLESTLGVERLAIAKQYADQIAAAGAAIATQDNNLKVRYTNAAASIANDPAQAENAKLFAFDTDAQAQRVAMAKSLADLYGTSYTTTEGYASQMLLLENTLGEERLAIATSYNQQLAAAQQQASGAATGVIQSITSFVTSLEGADSPLSPKDQLALQEKNFAKDTAASQSGDFTATSRLTSDASTLLSASKAYFGTGAGYVQDYQKIIDALGTISQTSPDSLTASAFASETRTQTDTLVDSLADLKAQLVNIRLAISQGSSAPRQLALAG